MSNSHLRVQIKNLSVIRRQNANLTNIKDKRTGKGSRMIINATLIYNKTYKLTFVFITRVVIYSVILTCRNVGQI